MPLTPAEVLRLAHAARLALGEAEAERIARSLAPVLEQMEGMLAVDVTGVDAVDGIGAAGMPLRADAGPPMAMALAPDSFAPLWRDGLFVVPPVEGQAADLLGDA